MKSKKPHHYIRPLIDKNNTSRAFVDLHSFLKVIFPNNELHQRIAHNIIEYLKKHGQAYLMTQIIPYIREEVKLTHDKITNPKGPYGTGNNNTEKIVSKDTIAKVFKAMWKSGLTSKPFRHSPVELSKVFSARLRDLADYWESYVEKYG